jgi:hypothetical protein
MEEHREIEVKDVRCSKDGHEGEKGGFCCWELEMEKKHRIRRLRWAGRGAERKLGEVTATVAWGWISKWTSTLQYSNSRHNSKLHTKYLVWILFALQSQHLERMFTVIVASADKGVGCCFLTDNC